MLLSDKIRTTLFSLIDLIDSSGEEELHYKPAPDSWSILECVEHICLVNHNIAQLIQTPPPASHENKLSELYGEGKLNHLLVTKRDMKRVAPEKVTPKGIFKTPGEAKEAIYRDTETILRTLEATSIGQQTHTIPHHALGEMTKTDWLHFMIAHTQRHLLQIETIKEHYKKK